MSISDYWMELIGDYTDTALQYLSEEQRIEFEKIYTKLEDYVLALERVATAARDVIAMHPSGCVMNADMKHLVLAEAMAALDADGGR